MSLQRELKRLEDLGRNPSVSSEQRRNARDTWTTINDNLILAAWNRIKRRTAVYEVLVSKLAAVVDDISANQLTTAMDDITSILNEVTNAANEGSESSGNS